MAFLRGGSPETILHGLVFSVSVVLQEVLTTFKFRSTQRLKQLVRQTRGRVIPGHDEGTFLEIQREKDVYT